VIPPHEFGFTAVVTLHIVLNCVELAAFWDCNEETAKIRLSHPVGWALTRETARSGGKESPVEHSENKR
jgi:hypothetical protein